MYQASRHVSRRREHNRFSNQKRVLKTFNPYEVIKNSQVAVAPTAKYTSVNRFEDFKINPLLKEAIRNKNYQTPTPIQDQVIPQVLMGKDVIGIANTGTGKTAAFLIPLLDKIYHNRQEKVLIVAPTRELAVQIRDECVSLSYKLSISTALCIGGMNIIRQKEALRRNVNIVIGTPGRIKDLVMSKVLNLATFRNVVLDEADHMVDIGFIHDITFLIQKLPQQRQSLFFSATIAGKVREVLEQFVKDPVTISVKTRETAENIDQSIIPVDKNLKKIEQLQKLLSNENFEKVLIFGRTKWGVQKLSEELIERGFKAGAIHGNKNQNQRLRILDQFKKSQITILLATDVAARGLDIPNVSHVINYDLPESYEAYIHRIGRTGRAEKKGIALTFSN